MQMINGAGLRPGNLRACKRDTKRGPRALR